MTAQLVYVTMYFEIGPAAGDALGVFTTREAAKSAASTHYRSRHDGDLSWTDEDTRSEATHRGARYLVRAIEVTSHQVVTH